MAYKTRRFNGRIHKGKSIKLSVLTPISLRSNLIFSSYLRLVIPMRLFSIRLTKKLNLWLTAPKVATPVN